MSEINSIANGTYMIGETTQTELQAGPGISITKPSEGTVRIAADETVLWEGFKTDIPNTGESSYTLSELATNFEAVKIEYVIQGNTITPRKIGNRGAGTLFYRLERYVTYIHSVMNGNDSNTGFTLYDIDSNIYDMDKLTWNVKSALRGQNNNAQWFHITRIVGINRKENA